MKLNLNIPDPELHINAKQNISLFYLSGKRKKDNPLSVHMSDALYIKN